MPKRDVWDRTAGLCHICGRQTTFEHHAADISLSDSRQMDHDEPQANVDAVAGASLLCACARCKQAKKASSGRGFRRGMLMGTVAFGEYKSGKAAGLEVGRLRIERLGDRWLARQRALAKKAGVTPS